MLGLLVAANALAGFGLVAVVTIAFPLDPRIALPVSIAGIDPRVLGLCLWIAVCLITSSRGMHEEGRAAMNFGFGPTVAAAALGGPAAAAWVAMLGNTEVREVRGEVPWYGVVANHGMVTFSFGVGGIVMSALGHLAGPRPPALVDLLVVAAGSGAGVAVNAALAVMVVWARTGRSPDSSLGIGGGTITLAFGAETCLAWLITNAYVLVAWWSPALFVVADLAAGASLDRQRVARQLRRHQVTELPNGIALREYAGDLRQSSRLGACAFYIDLDGFKAINDDHDHGVGDDVLRIVGSRLVEVARTGDFVGHLHGDEFVVLASGVMDDLEAAAIATRLVSEIEAPMSHRVGELRVSATVGFCRLSELRDFGDAIREADRTMALAKEEKARALGRERRRT